jgi:CRISPR type I-E-associated protein CasB/Cse2
MREELEAGFARLRSDYDELRKRRPGDQAVLRRCRDGDAVQLEGVFWRLVGQSRFPDKLPKSSIAMVVSAFPGAEHRLQRGFRFGRFMADLLDPQHDGDASRSLRFRELVRADDTTELCRRLRRLLRRAEGPVDWGVLGADIVQFDHPNSFIQRKWIQDFFSPLPEANRV